MGRLSIDRAGICSVIELPSITEQPEIDDAGPGSGGDHWIVTVFNNDYNSVDEVIGILIQATQCSLDEAQIETWEIHFLGKSVVHHGARDECDKAAQIISLIGIRVEVTEE